MTDQYQSVGGDAGSIEPGKTLTNPSGTFGGYSAGNSRGSGGTGGFAAGGASGRPASVVGEEIGAGGSNVSAGVIRRKKRVIKGLVVAEHGYGVEKNYRTSNAVMFNNAGELFQDMVSRQYAQEIIEEFFDSCGVDVADAQVAKYAEDVLFLFLIATTASNKADYDKQVAVPTKSGNVELDFAVFSSILQAGHGVTRRNFSRGVANDMRKYLKQPENTYLLPTLATRVGCDPQFAHLAFDGSTHCSGMTSREVSFTKTLESRNLFEDDAVLGSGASDRLMQGLPAGPRSVVPR
jgi:hypothetical protein